MAWRDARSQHKRFALYTLSVAIGIGALVAIHCLKASVHSAIGAQSKLLLGADLMLSSRRPLDEETIRSLAPKTRAIAAETAFSSMIGPVTGTRTRLVQVRAIRGGFPFRASVETVPPGLWSRLDEQPGMLVEAALLADLGVQVGDRLKLGAIELPVLGTVLKGVPRSSRFSGLTPEVFMREADLAATGLQGARSLVFYHRFLELNARNEAARLEITEEIRKRFAGNAVQIQTPESRRETLAEGLDKAAEFLGICALSALMLGGIGVAGAMHTHIRSRIQSLAILLCLGCSTPLAFGIYGIQTLVLAGTGALLGALGGVLTHALLVTLLAHQLPLSVAALPEAGVVFGAMTGGFLLCCGFGILPLLRISQCSPLATLSERLPEGRRSYTATGILALSLFALVWLVASLNGSRPTRALALSGGISLVFGCLAITALSLMRGARLVLRPAWPYLFRQGVSNLFRPHNQTLLFVLSLGLGVFLLLTTWFSKSLLLQKLQIDDQSITPSVILMDVQPDQTDLVRSIVAAQGLRPLEEAPIVTMRIESVRGVPVSALEPAAEEGGSAQGARVPRGSPKSIPRWVLEREYRSTYRNTVHTTETVLAGSWPPPALPTDGPIPISVEERFSQDLRLGVGDELVFDVQGIPMRCAVSCIRRVDWRKLNLNFIIVFPAGVLEQAPHSHLVSLRLPEGKTSGELQRSLLEAAPNVSAVDLSSLLATVSDVLQKAARVVELMAGFTLAAGLPILLGALWNGRDQRVRESALLRTLGASEKQIRAILVYEYATLGLIAGIAGTVLALGARFALAQWVFHSTQAPEFAPLVYSLTLPTLAALLAGLALSRGVCRQSPLLVLRQGR
jgi:putative ABC transport system permease protein